MSLTVVPYLYRDPENYKAWEEIILDGAITDAQRAAVRASLSMEPGDPGFIPTQVGWPHAGAKEFSLSKSDHCWHELDVDEIYIVEPSVVQTTGHETVDCWVKKMEDAARAGWDSVRHAP